MPDENRVDDRPENGQALLQLTELVSARKNGIINADILAIAQYRNDAMNDTAKLGGKLVRRDVGLVDEGGILVTLTIWSSKGREFLKATCPEPVVLVRRANINLYMGNPSLTIASSWRMLVEPTTTTTTDNARLCGRIASLREWHRSLEENKRYCMPTRSLTGTRFVNLVPSFRIVEDLAYGSSCMPSSYMIFAKVEDIMRDDTVLLVCPRNHSAKALARRVDNSLYCAICDKVVDEPASQLFLKVKLIDANARWLWVKMFDKQAYKLVKTHATVFQKLMSTVNGWRQYDELLARKTGGTYLWKLSVCMETYIGQQAQCHIVKSFDELSSVLLA